MEKKLCLFINFCFYHVYDHRIIILLYYNLNNKNKTINIDIICYTYVYIFNYVYNIYWCKV